MTTNLPAYTPPPVTGIAFSSGTGSPQPLPPNSLCSKADALLVQAALGGTLVNAADYPALNMNFFNLNLSNVAQPWYLIGIPNPGFVGPIVALMYAPNNINGGGIGNPGSLVSSNGQVAWDPTAPAPTPPVPSASATPTSFMGVSLDGSGNTIDTVAAQLTRIINFFHVP